MIGGTHGIPTIVLGGTGYVAGELLRLIVGHPALRLEAVMSDSQPGEPVGKAFPHLAAVLGDTLFSSQADVEALLKQHKSPAMLSAAPHGVSAALIDALLKVAEASGNTPRVVDISADFRYTSAAAYEAVYRHPHGAPGRIAQFTCAVPEHLAQVTTPHVAHPGCFATTTLLAVVPLLKLGLVEPTLFVSAVSDGRTVAVMSVADNLNKGAAGGAVQWMNRLMGLPEAAGLAAPAAGWT